MKKHIPTNESGRSMVEMLGVLAIMGVLSIGAVAGYRWAMDKYAANDTIRELSLRAVTYAQQMQVGASALSSTEFHPENETRQGYPLTADVVDEDFQITLSQVPENVCAHILNMGWHLPFRTQVNDVTGGDSDTCQEGDNTLAFRFHSDLSGGEFVEISDQPSEPETTEFLDPEETIETDPFESTEVVSSDGFPESSEVTSSGYMMCQPGEFQDRDGNCRSCSYSSSVSATEAECAKCDDSSTPRFLGFSGYCYSCSVSGGVPTNADKCAKCDDSGTPRFMSTSGSCYSCSDSYGISATAARCAMCNDSSTPRFMSTNGDCYGCSYSSSVSATAAECDKCDDTDTPRFMNTYGSCTSCSDSYGVSATAAECAKCDDSSTPREMRNGICIKKGYCPEGFLSSFGSCYSCSYPAGAPATAAECAKCDDSSTPREMRNEFCIKKGYCPEGFIDFYGDCNSCSDSYSVSATEAECAKCDSTDTPRVLLENGYCALESCGAKQFQITTGECYSCSTSSSWLATADECAKCDSTDTPRVLLENGSCALESCGANRFRDTYGSCHSCSTSYGVSATTAAECAKCDKTGTPRYMNGSWCYNCPTSLSSGSLNTQEKCQSCRGTWNAETKKCS